MNHQDLEHCVAAFINGPVAKPQELVVREKNTASENMCALTTSRTSRTSSVEKTLVSPGNTDFDSEVFDETESNSEEALINTVEYF